ncbi:hypothetical protein FO519_006195 [Halicephalobus sp. NKZ332]|nr:hypothetical protein FO519_006195 [Halicephalobus sp. NKZ332]
MVDLNNPPSPYRRQQTTGNKIMAWTDAFFRYLRNIRQQPVPVQIGVGASGGFITGYFFTKGSKLVALVIGCSMIILQFFNYRGYIRFHTNQLEADLHSVKSRFEKELGLKRSGFPRADEMDDFIYKNGYLFSGFIAGNLVGYGLA